MHTKSGFGREKENEMRRRILMIAFIMAAMIIFCGCEKTYDTNTEGSLTEFTDDAGRKVDIPTKIEKVATLGTTGQIMMLPLASEMMVGINAPIETDASEYLSEDYSDMPVIGQYYGQRNLNIEELAGSGADIIIDLGDTKKNAADDMDEIQAQTGIPTIHINATLQTSPDAFRKLGDILDREKRAEELAECCESIYEKTYSVLEKAGDKKVSILSCSGSDGLTVTEKDSSHSEILDLVGENVAEVTGNGGIVDIEQIHIWDPDVILFMPDSIFSSVANMKEWSTLEAIKSGNYYKIPSGPYCWNGYPPTVNRYLGLLWMTAVLYPQDCDYDLQEEVSNYYKVFYGCELTDEQYDDLMEGAM